MHVLCTKPWSAVVFSATDFHDNPPRVVGSHYVACSATENAPYHAGDWKNTTTIYSGKCKKKKTCCALCISWRSVLLVEETGDPKKPFVYCILLRFHGELTIWGDVPELLYMQVTILKTKQTTQSTSLSTRNSI
jgi:hypothetical protein